MQSIARRQGDITKIPPEVKANILDRYKRGQSISFMCTALSKSKETLKAVLAEGGVAVEKHRGRWRPLSLGHKRS